MKKPPQPTKKTTEQADEIRKVQRATEEAMKAVISYLHSEESPTSEGAHKIIDYTRDDFTKTETRFDIIFDAVGKTSKAACRSATTYRLCWKRGCADSVID